MATATKEPLLVLLDGSSYLYRAFHALPPLRTSTGEPTGAIYGVLNMLRRLLQDYHPNYIGVVFDAKGKTFRHDLYTAYKANRPTMPDELGSQVEPLLSIIRAMGIPLLTIEGVEADDVIGTLATQAAQQNWQVVISTSDKDLAQLVQPNITLVNTMTDTQYTYTTVQEKFGVTPEQIVDYLALVGDSSDNIPGVPKVGPKTAAKWLQCYGSLDNLIAHASEITGQLGENLRRHLDQFPLTRQLLAIKCDLSLPIDLHDLKQQPADKEALRTWFQRLEFRRWLKELTTAHESSNNCDYSIILTEEHLQEWLNKLQDANEFALDTETTSLNPLDAQLVGIALAVRPHEAAYIPVAHNYSGAPQQLALDQVLQALQPYLTDPQKNKIGHNLKYDLAVLANHGCTVTGPCYDTMLESYVWNSTASRHNLNELALKHLDHQMIEYEEVAGKGSAQIGFNQVTLETACRYSGEDADIALQLHQLFYPKIKQETRLFQVLTTIEMPLVPVLARMENHGVLIDAQLLNQQSQELNQRMQELAEQAYQLAGTVFNLNSPKQLQTILFEQLQLPILTKTPKGQPSTAEPALQELAQHYELPRIILEYRQLSKLQSTYTDPLPKEIHPKTGRIHTSYHQAVTSTGRLSSSNPNLQNIPIRTPEGRRIRQAFIAPQGYQLIAADYSQIELRIMAHLSDDPGLQQAFAHGQDIHKATAAEIFGVPLATVTDLQRRNAKAVNFGLMYGMSAFGLARQLHISREEAEQYIQRYFSRYPKVHDYMETAREQARKLGYVETLFGRRLYLPEIHALNQQQRRAAERVAINAPLQGTAADIIKHAMIKVDQWLQAHQPAAAMLMQVHDELILEAPKDSAATIAEQVRQLMSQAAVLKVPLVVDIGIGDNWDEAH